MNHAHAGSNLSRVLHGKAYVMCHVSAFLMFGFFRWLPRPSREPRLKPRASSSHKCVPQIVSVADTTFHGFGMKKQKAKGAPTSICLHKLDIFFLRSREIDSGFPSLPCPQLRNSRVVEERVGQNHRGFGLHVIEGDVQQPQATVGS